MNERVTMMTALILAVLAGTSVGVTAQSEDVGPAGLSGSLYPLGTDSECAEITLVEVDGVWQTRGRCTELWMDTSDPRFTGHYTMYSNIDEHNDQDMLPVSVWVATATHRVENDDGAWLGDATTEISMANMPAGAFIDQSPLTVVFTGTGDYEGLTAVAWWLPQFDEIPVRGVIFPGSPPPAPLPVE